MKQISFIKSLMEFNKRVLYQGKVFPEEKCSLDSLKSKLFFNKVFISNMQEMFQKFDTSSIIEDYVDELGQYISNINGIIATISSEKDSVKISREDSFERRLSIEGKIADHIISKTYPNTKNVQFRFLNDYIYYLSLFDNGSVMISYIDMRSAVYHEVINCQMTEYKMYWKTDDCVRDYIRDVYHPIDTIAVRVTTTMDGKYVTKVEYNGSTQVMKNLVSMFRSNTLVISNPFIYVDDIEEIIDQNVNIISPISEAEFHPITIEDLLEEDILLEYPNDSFDKYLQFLSLVSESNDVKAIYITLYRIGKDPAIYYILRDAALRGIKVYANIELCATGEAINTMWLAEMKKVGINVTTYEAGHLKVHCKLTLVEFANGVSIAQIGTGNYHTKTVMQYTDLSLITSDADICQQIKKVFNIFRDKGDSDEVSFNKSLLVTRYNTRAELLKLIDEEGSKGSDGYIMIKCNSMDDEEFNIHLNKAADKGCRIDLIVRGVCTWIPNQPNVTVKSIVWDKLEHSRVFCFGRPNPIIYIGSLDLVTKKINKRIETLVLVKDPDIVIQLCHYLNRYITNTTNSWIQTSSGMYIKE